MMIGLLADLNRRSHFTSYSCPYLACLSIVSCIVGLTVDFGVIILGRFHCSLRRFICVYVFVGLFCICFHTAYLLYYCNTARVDHPVTIIHYF